MARIVIPDKAFTYDGLFDWDRIFSTALLMKVNPDIEITRGNKPPHNYDGLIYSTDSISFFNLYNDFAPVLGISDFVREDFGRKFVLPLMMAEKGVPNQLTSVIKDFNPQWDAKEITDDKFNEAVLFAGNIIDNSLEQSLARERLCDYIRTQNDTEIDAHILTLEKEVPWKDVIDYFPDINIVIARSDNQYFLEIAERNKKQKIQTEKSLPYRYDTLEEALDAAKKIEAQHEMVQEFVREIFTVQQDAITGYMENRFATVTEFRGFLASNATSLNLGAEQISDLSNAFEKIGKMRLEGDGLEMRYAEFDFLKLVKQDLIEGISPEIAMTRDSIGDGIPDWGEIDSNGDRIYDGFEYRNPDDLNRNNVSDYIERNDTNRNNILDSYEEQDKNLDGFDDWIR